MYRKYLLFFWVKVLNGCKGPPKSRLGLRRSAAGLLVLILASPSRSQDSIAPVVQDPVASEELQLETAIESIPEAKPKYMGRRIAPAMGYTHAGWLIRSERQQEEDTQQALDNLQLKAGMTVCDMGCGNGYYSLEIAKRVAPSGKVLAVDIQQEMLHLLHLRAEEAQIENIQTVLGSVVDPQLPTATVDLVLMVDVYHEFSHPQQMLAAIRKSLVPQGRIALVEFREEDPRVPILPLHKMSKRQILREFKANGFKLVEEYDQLPWQHLMFFQKD
jgi:ubiquinone/menaquinone biosynthesis C-methylase UbiE